MINGVVDIGADEYVDSIPPYTTASLAGNVGLNGWYLGPYVTVTLNADDGDGTGVDYTKYAYGASGSFITYTGPFNYTLLGNNNLRYYSADRAGNVETERITAIRFDNTLPSVTVSSPAATTSYSRVTPAPFAGNAFEYVSGLLSVRWINAQGGSGTCTGTTSWTASVPLAQGSNRVTIWAKDNAGNAKSTFRTITFDNIAPTATTTNPVNGATGVSRTAPNIRVNFSEAIAQGSAYGNVTLKKGKTNVAITKSIVGNRLNITPATTLAKNSLYTVTVPVSAVQDLAGNPLAVQKVFSFTTGN